jgi:hypothetical protein
MSLIYSVLVIVGLLTFVFSYLKSKKGESFVVTNYLFFLGIFVWGDGLIFGPLWSIAGVFFGLQNDLTGLLVFISVFWLVRSYGEVMYWMQEQFVKNHRNDCKKMIGYSIVKNESIYFLYQIVWQSVMIISIISTIYFVNIWIS